MKKFLLLFIIFTSVNNIFSQQTTIDFLKTGIFPQAISGGKVTITQDQRLQTIIDNHIEANSTRPLNGWRVQIYFGSGAKAKTTAESIKTGFLTDYPDIEVYLEYDAPYFKVNVGNFRNKLDAEKFKFKLQGEYEKMFLVEAKIEYPSLD